jgi:hypothetical protein
LDELGVTGGIGQWECSVTPSVRDERGKWLDEQLGCVMGLMRITVRLHRTR